MSVLVRSLIAACTITLGVVDVAAAGIGCGPCRRCGCADGCQSICRLVKEEKKIETVCYGCTCEDFCVPCCSERGCKHSTEVCAECETADCDEPYGKAKRIVWFDWLPCRAKIFTKKKLHKKTVVTKVPGYKWVVEDLCAKCAAQSPSVEVEPGYDVPPSPANTAQAPGTAAR